MLTKLKPSQVSAIQKLAVTAEWAEFKRALTEELEALKNMLVESDNSQKISRLQGAITAIGDVLDIEKITRR